MSGTIKIGDKIRSYDFEPFEGRKDRYVEGFVIDINTLTNCYVIDVTLDTVYKSGVRTMIQTPIELIIGGWEGRITKVAQ